MSIITEYPSWYIIVCVLVGLAVGFGLYLKDRSNRHYPNFLRWILITMRSFTVALLCFFLLNPLLKKADRIVEKPILIIAQDNSESLIIGSDSAFMKSQYSEQLNQMIASLGDEYEVKTYTFGKELVEGLDRLDYSDKSTNFSNLLDEVYNKYSNRNLGAVIIGSDGLYNQGINPRYSFKKLNVPIYTIALGDTVEKRDVLIKEVQNNRLAYLGNKFPIKVDIEAKKAKGEKVNLTILRKGSIVFSQNLNIDGDSFQEEILVNLDAKEVGLQRYSIQVSAVSNEVTEVNNQQDVFIDVLDSKQKILILAHSPHPDLGALRLAIESNQNYKVETKISTDFSGSVLDYNLVIFHQLPDVTAKSLSQANECLNGKVPALFVVGSQMNFSSFNLLNLGFSYLNTNDQSNDVNAIYQNGFNLFKLTESTQKLIVKLPPLNTPFGTFEFSDGVTKFINQRIGSIETQNPLIAFNEYNGNKIGLIGGEGIWRWRTVGFLEDKSHLQFNELSTKIIQYLASKDDKSQFRITSKSDFLENEEILFNGELYNEVYEPINDRGVSLKVFNESGKEFNYEFSKTEDAYRLNAGSLPVGNYRYEAKTNYNGRELSEYGEFSVSPIFLEQVNTQADHRLLYNFAKENGGQMVSQGNISEIPNLIAQNEVVHSTSYETKTLSDLINLKWLFFVILGMLSLEWLIRKRNGTY